MRFIKPESNDYLLGYLTAMLTIFILGYLFLLIDYFIIEVNYYYFLYIFITFCGFVGAAVAYRLHKKLEREINDIVSNSWTIWKIKTF